MKMKKGIVVSAALLILLSGCQNIQANASITQANVNAVASMKVSFLDIPGHWAIEAIEKAVSKGYVDGYQDGSFKPDQNVSRAEFIKMAVTALKQSPKAKPTDTEWFDPFVTAAVEAGILRYEDFNTGNMNTPMTRQEMARIAVRAVDKAQQANTEDKALVYEAVKKGLIQGLAKGELGLDQPTTRAQSVTIIERILSVKNGGKLPLDKSALSYAEIEYKGHNLTTMLNGKPRYELPFETELFTNVTIKIPKIIIVDLSDPNSAYYDYFRSINIGRGVKSNLESYLGDKYLIAYWLEVTNKESREGLPHQWVRQTIFDLYATYTFSDKDWNGFYWNEVGTTSGWFLGVRAKTTVDPYIQKDGYINGLHLKMPNGKINFLTNK